MTLNVGSATDSVRILRYCLTTQCSTSQILTSEIDIYNLHGFLREVDTDFTMYNGCTDFCRNCYRVGEGVYYNIITIFTELCWKMMQIHHVDILFAQIAAEIVIYINNLHGFLREIEKYLYNYVIWTDFCRRLKYHYKYVICTDF